MVEFNPLDPETMRDPVPHLARLRSEDPVQWVEPLQVWFVSRHDLVTDALRHPEVFSSEFPKSVLPLSEEDQRRLAAAMAEGLPRPRTMITADGQVHTRYRRLVSKAFSPRSIAAFEPMVRTITTRLIDSWIDRERIEFVEDFAVPLPVEVIAKALNVPEDRLADFRRWSDATVLTFGATPTRVAATGRPVFASRQISRCRVFRKMRSAPLSRHAATPRWMKPWPLAGCPAS